MADRMNAVQLISPPTGWPESFNTPELQAYITNKLAGERVRLCGKLGPAEQSKVAKLKLSASDTRANAVRVRQATGWSIIAGFALYERPPGSAGDDEGRYAAEQRWWNAKTNKDGSSGKWVDASPGRPAEVVLVESPKTPVPGEDSEEDLKKLFPTTSATAKGSTPAKRFDHSDTVQEAGKVYGAMSSSVSKEFKVFDAQRAEEERQKEAVVARAREEALTSQARGSAYGAAPRAASVDVHELD